MKERIEISKRCPSYWEYDGEPVLLLGGSVEDNLFQIPDLEDHLRLLKSVGGNYVRCTMSSRDEGNVWPFEKAGELYDLHLPSKQYWRRFSDFLSLTYQMDIIVQVEVWATFDFYRENWEVNPFNPKNNLNYDAAQSRLPLVVDSHPVKTENDFFWSVPAEENNEVVLKYQEQFVDILLSHSLLYPHVLYCIDNETSVTPEWGKFWARYIKGRAAEQGLSVHVTEMWDPHDLMHEMHRATFDHPEIYSFVDISQNNHQKGQRHWDNAQWARTQIRDPVRPINNVKIYGATGGRFGDGRDGIERFWRNVFGKMASARLHRPPAGLGLSPLAQAQIKSARMLTDAMDVFECDPHNDLLSEREENEAYCIANPEREAAVFFTRAGEVVLDTSRMKGNLTVRWLNIAESEWLEPQYVASTQSLRLTTPLEGVQAVLVQSRR